MEYTQPLLFLTNTPVGETFAKMEPTARYLQLMLLCQVVISCWGAYQSYNAIIRLRKYEETAKKLADWSSEAERQLHKTRTTQTSGALAVWFIQAQSIQVSPNQWR